MASTTMHVPVGDRLEELLAHAGEGEDLLDDDGPADERAEVEPDERDETEERVAQRVADRARAEAETPLARAVVM